MNPEEFFGKDYNTFEEKDPFNPNNLVTGFISRKANEYYGALIITKVNGREVIPQLIMATPKMHYPFVDRADGSRNYFFPSAKSIEIYEKLDGTNILCYFYNDGKNEYWSAKTRLRPFLSSGRFGNFLEMWKEVGMPHIKKIHRAMRQYNCNLSFELYGARNPHLISYSNSLDVALLFGVTNTGRVLSLADMPDSFLPTADMLALVGKDYIWNYEEMQRTLQSKLKKEDEGYYSGSEGAVWYLKTTEGSCIQFKCKPETIEAIHFSAGVGIDRNVILATCWNALENTDTLTIDFVKQLLFEEFDSIKIEGNHNLIEKCIAFVQKEAEFRESVILEYRKTGKNILLQKQEVMREISDKFPREKMGKVYSIIMQKG